MRVVLDANVLISYLLGHDEDSPPRNVLRRFIAGEFELLISELTLTEFHRSVHRKSWLTERIAREDLDTLIDLLRSYATILPVSSSPPPRLTRDPHDDYLVALAIDEGADFLVSGDRDLLSLGTASITIIVSPASFNALLETIDRRS